MIGYWKKLINGIYLAVVFGLFANCRAWGEIRYVLTDLGTLGGTSSYAYGINESGQITGYTQTAAGSNHAFLYTHGIMTDIGTLGGDSSTGYDINDNGWITGEAQTASGHNHVFLSNGSVLYDLYFQGVGRSINNNGQITGKLGPSGGAYTQSHGTFVYNMETRETATLSSGIGFGINDNGQVAGWDGLDASFIYNEGAIKYLGQGVSYGINNSGQVTGHDFILASIAFLYSDDTMTYLGTLGGNESAGYAINDNGWITGQAQIADGSWHAFLYSNGVMTDINTLIDPSSGWTLIGGYDINNRGQICGYGINPSGHEQAFLLTPIPEPLTIWTFSAGLVLLVRQRKFFSSHTLDK